MPIVEDLVGRLRECWADTVASGNLDTLQATWDDLSAKVAPSVRREECLPAPADRLLVIEAFEHIVGGRCWPWALVRLSQCPPFNCWSDQIEHLFPQGGPTVGVAGATGHVLSMRVYVLSPEIAPGRSWREDDRGTDPPFWPLGLAPTSVIRHMPLILIVCVGRNLLNVFASRLFFVLLNALAVSLLAGTAWGPRDETILHISLWTAVISFGSIVVLVLANIVWELFWVWREGWLRIWKTSLVRIAFHPRLAPLPEGQSYGLAVILASLSGLAERVLAEGRVGRFRSRFSRLMENLRDERASFVATGCITGLGLWCRGVDASLEAKYEAAARATPPVPAVYAPASWKNRALARDKRAEPTLLSLQSSVPRTVLKAGRSFRGFCWVALLVAAFLVHPALSAVSLMRNLALAPPSLYGKARWWPRDKNQPDAMLIQLRFRNVVGDPNEYFAVVQGSTHGPGDRSPEFLVIGEERLISESSAPNAADANVSLKASREAPDPHNLVVDIYRRRMLAGVEVSPVRVITFGLSEVETVQ